MRTEKETKPWLNRPHGVLAEIEALGLELLELRRTRD
jgi:hypothetical protein